MSSSSSIPWRSGLCLCLLALAVMQPGCQADEAAEPPCSPLIHIDKLQLEPMIGQTALIDRASLAQFDARGAVVTRCLSQPFHYAWYGDVDDKSSIPLPFYHACGNTALCQMAPCAGLKNTDTGSHRLLLVVSDQPLPESAKTPYHFPEDAALDFVEWQLELHGKCPN